MKVVLTTVSKYSMRYRHNMKTAQYEEVQNIRNIQIYIIISYTDTFQTSTSKRYVHNRRFYIQEIPITSKKLVFTNIQMLVFTNIRPPKDAYKTTVWSLCCPSARGFLSGSPSAVEARSVRRAAQSLDLAAPRRRAGRPSSRLGERRRRRRPRLRWSVRRR